jgi:hypothetical protein
MVDRAEPGHDTGLRGAAFIWRPCLALQRLRVLVERSRGICSASFLQPLAE